MKVLESTPYRYDRGLKLLTLGKIQPIYERLSAIVNQNDNVLDIGCGTGLLSILAADRGGKVKGIDINPDMLNIAEQRRQKLEFGDKITFEEKGIAELDSEHKDAYDVIFASLLFSELETYEQEYALDQIYKMLKTEGKFVLLDEIRSSNPVIRLIQFLIRLPIKLITYIATQTTTHALIDLEEKLHNFGFYITGGQTYLLGSLKYVICKKV